MLKPCCLNPDIRAHYQKRALLEGLSNAYTAAIKDYLNAPSLNSIDTDYYKGLVGDIIWIIAQDDFKNLSMIVILQKADGSIIETGSAVLEDGRWKFVATQTNAALPGTKVIATATDRSGKQATLEKVL